MREAPPALVPASSCAWGAAHETVAVVTSRQTQPAHEACWLRSPGLRLAAQYAGTSRDLRAVCVPYRLLGLDQPAPVQPAATARVQIRRDIELYRHTPVTRVLDFAVDHHRVHRARGHAGGGAGYPHCPAAQPRVSRAGAGAHAGPAAVGNPARGERPDVAMDLRRKGGRA